MGRAALTRGLCLHRRSKDPNIGKAEVVGEPSECPTDELTEAWSDVEARWQVRAPRTTEAEIALDRDAPPETESGLREELNLVCNRALRSMLRDDLLQVRAVKEDLNVLGASFAAQDNLKAALFCYVLMQMTSHVIPKQAEGLQGSYKAAFEKLYVLLEDSGWELQPEEEESEVAGDS
ncbi:hypothetical protein N2152v2_001229 [Parachlorella kessleri]